MLTSPTHIHINDLMEIIYDHFTGMEWLDINPRQKGLLLARFGINVNFYAMYYDEHYSCIMFTSEETKHLWEYYGGLEFPPEYSHDIIEIKTPDRYFCYMPCHYRDEDIRVAEVLNILKKGEINEKE